MTHLRYEEPAKLSGDMKETALDVVCPGLKRSLIRLGSTSLENLSANWSRRYA